MLTNGFQPIKSQIYGVSIVREFSGPPLAGENTRSVPSRLWARVDSLTNNCSLHSNKTRLSFHRIRLKLTLIDSVTFSHCSLMCVMCSCDCLAGRDRFLNTPRFTNMNCATIAATVLFALAATILVYVAQARHVFDRISYSQFMHIGNHVRIYL